MYIYNADVYCSKCGADLVATFEREGVEDTGDSNDYPQSTCSLGESDGPHHCGSMSDCLDPETLSDGTQVSALLSDGLTSDGAEYVTQAVNEDPTRPLMQLWAEVFSWLDYETKQEYEY